MPCRSADQAQRAAQAGTDAAAAAPAGRELLSSPPQPAKTPSCCRPCQSVSIGFCRAGEQAAKKEGYNAERRPRAAENVRAAGAAGSGHDQIMGGGRITPVMSTGRSAQRKGSSQKAHKWPPPASPGAAGASGLGGRARRGPRPLGAAARRAPLPHTPAAAPRAAARRLPVGTRVPAQRVQRSAALRHTCPGAQTGCGPPARCLRQARRGQHNTHEQVSWVWDATPQAALLCS